MAAAAADTIYLAGLFLNYGAFLLSHYYPTIYSNYRDLYDFRERIQLERSEFGISYPEVSALTLKRFQVPDFITRIIRDQADAYNISGAENSCLELGRLIYTFRDKDYEHVHSQLRLDDITSLVARSTLELRIEEFGAEQLKNLRLQTREFAA